jgi:sec-independent protein translocase protein TatB
MFDIGFWELCLLGVAALLVVGPNRLPRIAYEAGLWFGRLQRYLRKARMDIERELHEYEIKQTLEEQKRELQQVKRMAEDSGKDLYQGLKSLEAGDAEQKDKAPAEAGSEQSPADSRQQSPERDRDE